MEMTNITSDIIHHMRLTIMYLGIPRYGLNIDDIRDLHIEGMHKVNGKLSVNVSGKVRLMQSDRTFLFGCSIWAFKARKYFS